MRFDHPTSNTAADLRVRMGPLFDFDASATGSDWKSAADSDLKPATDSDLKSATPGVATFYCWSPA